MAALRALTSLGGRCGLLTGLPSAAAVAPARFSTALAPTLAAALHTPSSARRDQEEDKPSARSPALLGARSVMRIDSFMPRAFSTEVSKIGETPSGLPPTVHALKYPTSEIAYDETLHTRFEPGSDASKRAFTYMILTGGRFIYASAIRLVVLKFLLSMTASDDVLAMASLEVELGNIEVGQTITVKWRGKPVFIRRRTEKEIAQAQEAVTGLRDPQDDSERAVNPEWLVVLGVCTHLGCVPLANAGDYNGWFCPCHGSHYDISGRIRKGPAPYNLEVPQYKFMDDDTLLVG